MQIFDMRNPQNWFVVPEGRQFIYHHGPTNSGKTSSAINQLKELSKDKKGVYMAPLRLLAWQMQNKLGKCNLVTGQDKQYRASNLTSCTIQAFNTSQQYDVAIIDEIQMIDDNQRGWSWTKALLSLKAKRIHLCGDARALDLVSNIVKLTKGTLQERRYSRLGKLILIHKLYDISNIQKGDCLIQFSVQELHKLRRKILQIDERKNQQNDIFFNQQNQDLKQNLTRLPPSTPSKVAMVYGKLPPECRKQQARKFNEGIAPYLVATNAIGMGLNLNIKKIIFAGLKKRNNKGQQVELEEHEIQQIAGRAGRGTQDGLVQCFSFDILKKIRRALKNVNKTYGINLQNVQVGLQSRQNQQQENEENLLVKTNIKQKHNQFLNRELSQKQCSIKKAGLFIEQKFLKRVIFYFENFYKTQITLGNALQNYLYLSQLSDQRFFLVMNNQLIQWINRLQPFKFEIHDTFTLAKGFSLHYNSQFCKIQVLKYAQQFKQERRVDIPKEKIKARNQLILKNNYQKLGILQANYSLLQVYIYLWNQYQFVFWDIDTAKQMKTQIAQLIKIILQDQKGFNFSPFQKKNPKYSNRRKLNIQERKQINQKQNKQYFKFQKSIQNRIY